MPPTLAVNGGEPVRDAEFHPWPVYDDREVEALQAVVESRNWGINGDRTEAFTDAFTDELGVEHGVTCTSGTSALVIALRAVGVGPGDEVIIPPYSFVATASAVLEVNAVPIFADIEPGSLCLDPAAVERALTPRTAAVIPVHVGGRPADMAALTEVCETADVAIVEDCAHAHGTRVDGAAVGTFGDAGCFSFQSTKNLTAGEGGFISTDRDDVYNRAWSIMNVGRVPDGDWYEHPVMGSNYRMTEFQAAILQEGLTRMDDQLARREAAAQRLHEGLAAIDGIEPQSEHPAATARAYYHYILRIGGEARGGVDKGTFLAAVRAEGIPLGGGYSPLYEQALFTEIRDRVPAVAALATDLPDYASVSCPETERASDICAWTPQEILLAPEAAIDDIVRGIEKVARGTDQLTGVE